MEKLNEKNKLSCALCNAKPHVYCEPDEAFLCYTCDARVHGANFLVARHARAVLCRTCSSPAPVHASGPSLDTIVIATCDWCADSIAAGEVRESVSGSGSGSGSDLKSCLEEDEGENHVVPSSVDEAVAGWGRRRVSNGLADQDDKSCCSTSDPSHAESRHSSDDDATSSSSQFNPRAHKRSFFRHVSLSN